MSALDRLKLDEPFDNFDDVLKFVERLTNEHFMPLRITDSNLLKSITSLLNARSYISIQIFNFIMLNLFALISVNTI